MSVEAKEEELFVIDDLQTQGVKILPKEKRQRVLVKGDIWNRAEDSLTIWLFYIRNSLKEFRYLPSSTNGGTFPRPLYFQGDRAGQVEFPNVEIIEMNSSAASSSFDQSFWTPKTYGWIVPKLRILRIVKNSEKQLNILGFVEQLCEEQGELKEVWLDDVCVFKK